jgi:hypothetical protein
MRLLPLLPLALLLSGCGADSLLNSSREYEDFSFDFPLRSGGRITLETYNGSVEVTAWDQEKIEIRGRKHAATKGLLAEVRVEANALGPDAVAIRVVPPVPRGNSGARFTLRVPRRTTVERIVSANGAIRMDGLEGPGMLRTSNGRIAVGRHQGKLELTTSNGAIDLGSVTGTVIARTANGRVNVDELTGGLDAATSNGSIAAKLLDAPPEGPLRFLTTNGSVDVRLLRAPRGDLRVRSSNGAVTLRMPAGSDARLSLNTSNATVRNEFPLSGSEGISTKTRVEGKIGNGGPLLDISTTNATIGLLRSIL